MTAVRLIIAACGAVATFGLAVLALAVPLRHGMDASAYLTVIAFGLAITLAGIQLATPKRKAVR